MVIHLDEQTLKIIDIRSGEPIGGFLAHQSYVYDVSFGPGGLVLTTVKQGAFLWSDCDTDEPHAKQVVTASRTHRAFFLPDAIAEDPTDTSDAVPPDRGPSAKGKVDSSRTSIRSWPSGRSGENGRCGSNRSNGLPARSLPVAMVAGFFSGQVELPANCPKRIWYSTWRQAGKSPRKTASSLPLSSTICF